MGRHKKNISFTIYPQDLPEYDKKTATMGSRVAVLMELARLKVDIGLLDDASERSKTLLRIHEAGSPIMNIPPRPVIKPALNDSMVKWTMTQHMKFAVECADKADRKGMMENLESAGKAGVEGIQHYINMGKTTPNALITIHGGWMRNKVSGKPFYVEGKGDKPPLVNTGQLLSEFSYKVKTR